MISKFSAKRIQEIIDNNYLGKPDKRGKQKDYGDYIDQLNNRLWALKDREHDRLVLKRLKEAEIGANDSTVYDFELPEVAIEALDIPLSVRLGFNNKWRHIGMRLSA
jgi:hypothetical protein